MVRRLRPNGLVVRDATHVVLVLSADAVGAALIGALVETLGYGVRFLRSAERPGDVLRERPAVAMVDCDDPTVMTDETLEHASSRGVPILLYGSPHALQRVRQLAVDHELAVLTMPAAPHVFANALRALMSASA